MFKKLGINILKIVAERQLRKMLFVAFVGTFGSLISIENSYASSVNVLYTILDDTEPQKNISKKLEMSWVS